MRSLGRLAQFLMNNFVFQFTAPGRQDEMRRTMTKYFDHVLGESFENYLRLFLEIDAHSVFHVLQDIEAPTYIISGLFDILTPPRHSFELAWVMPHAEHQFLWRSSHFSLLERPDLLLPKIARFLDERAQWVAPSGASSSVTG